mmetsp:Transcript_10312/g.31042  ORF Transcript_10312/g.31042 Transcript_10312/m.31042 type:complete len:231 (+) Transcript_10312:299-991(+)
MIQQKQAPQPFAAEPWRCACIAHARMPKHTHTHVHVRHVPPPFLSRTADRTCGGGWRSVTLAPAPSRFRSRSAHSLSLSHLSFALSSGPRNGVPSCSSGPSNTTWALVSKAVRESLSPRLCPSPAFFFSLSDKRPALLPVSPVLRFASHKETHFPHSRTFCNAASRRPVWEGSTMKRNKQNSAGCVTARLQEACMWKRNIRLSRGRWHACLWMATQMAVWMAAWMAAWMM